MKKIIYLFVFSLLLHVASGQKKQPKSSSKKTDSTTQCKPKNNGKHCSKQ